MKKTLALLLSCMIVSTTGITFAVNAEEISEDVSAYDDTNATGLLELTDEDLAWMEENMPESKGVLLNEIGAERINEELESDGIEPYAVSAAEIGEETISDDNQAMAVSAQSTSVTPLLSSVDNSTDSKTSKYFPPQASQGTIGSCAAFASTYYQMTYMNALANDYDVKNDSSKILSPKFTYNLLNGGVDNGSSTYSMYGVVKKHGCPSIVDFPYNGDKTNALNYLEWPTTADIWESALYNRVDSYGYGAIESSTATTPVEDVNDTDLDAIKSYLINGYVLNINTYVRHWNIVTDSEYGSICISVNAAKPKGGHAMTVVGYDDDIYYDINQDGIEDPGEFGAFKIINSWGTSGQEYWFMYDALNQVSSTGSSATSDLAVYKNRLKGWWYNRYYWVTMCKNYTPKLTAEFSVTTNARNSIYLSLGAGTTNDTTPTYTWTPVALYGKGGAYSIDGTTDSSTAEVVLDYSNLIDENDLNSNNYKQRWFLSTSNSAIAINGFTAEDIPFGDTYSCTDTLSGDNKNIYVDAQLPLKVAKNKVWTLSFNYPLNSSTVNSNTVYVKDASGTSFPVTLAMPDTKSITVTGTKNYVSGTYYKLTVNGVKTLGGNSLGSAVNKKFVIE